MTRLPYRVLPEDPRAPDVRALADAHRRWAGEQSPPEDVHAVPAEALADPAVTLLSARDAAGELLGIGALRELGDGHAELKAMHVRASARGTGVGRALAEALVDLARRRGLRRVSLETGTQEAFGAARALYAGLGFRWCPPFGPYRDSPHSVCLTLPLRPVGGQDGHLVRCEWGAAGTGPVADGGAVVVVDVLSFTTSVCVLVDRGTAVVPSPWRDGRAEALAREHGAELAVGRREVSAHRPWSLSPAALLRAPSCARLVLPSPNGSALSAAATGPVFAACLRNASAVGRRLRALGHGTDRPLTVVPAGERWPDGALRPALEDLLGAGAVLSALDLPDDVLSAEARAARALAEGAGADGVVALVRGSSSAQELVDSGFADDVDVAVARDVSDGVPVLVDGVFRSR